MPESGSAAVRVTTVAAVSVVAAVAATVSFMHMHHLAHRADEGWRAWLVPLAVDGLVVAASMTMMARRRAGKNAGWLAWVSLGAGIAASLAANVAAAQPTLIGRAVAAWPPLALLLAYELLMDQIRNARDNVATQPGKSSSTVDGIVPANPSAATTAVAAAEHAGMPTTTAHSTNGHAPHYPPPGDGGTLAAPAHGTASRNGSTPSSAPAPHPALPPDVPDIGAEENTRHAARHYYRQTLADGRPCTGKQLADHFGRSERWGRYQIRAATPYT
jgi:hypothetical protein